MQFSILLTSAGRRTSLLKAFVAAASQCNIQVIAGDRDRLAPALYLANAAVKLPPILSDEYVPFLLTLVQERNIQMIVPTIDTELPVLAANYERFRAIGCNALISSTELIDISGDKWPTANVFSGKGIRTPRSWLPGDMSGISECPSLFIKPRDGSASMHAYPTTAADVNRLLGHVPNAIIQECLSGPEITIDCLLGFGGEPVHYCPRVRIRTVGGESIQGVTIDDNNGLDEWIVKVMDLCGQFGGRGPLTLQAFLTHDGPVLTEINPRFGGGFPLTHAAGGLYPEWLLNSMQENSTELRLGQYQRGLYMTRYYVEHFTTEPVWG